MLSYENKNLLNGESLSNMRLSKNLMIEKGVFIWKSLGKLELSIMKLSETYFCKYLAQSTI